MVWSDIDINKYFDDGALDWPISLLDGIRRLATQVPGYEWLLRATLEQTSDPANSTIRAVLHIPCSAAPPPEWVVPAGASVLTSLREIKKWVDEVALRPSLTELMKRKLETYWADTRRPGLSGLGLKVTTLAPDRLLLVFYALQGGAVRLTHTLRGSAEINAFKTSDLNKLADSIYERGPVNVPAPISTPEEAKTAFGCGPLAAQELGPGIAERFGTGGPPEELSAVAFRPRYCARCGHDRGCMCPRVQPERKPQVIKDPLGGRARNRM